MRLLCLLLIPLSLAEGGVDLYLDPAQTEELFGVRRPEGIFYVRDGVVNQYALGFHEQVRTAPRNVIRTECLAARK